MPLTINKQEDIKIGYWYSRCCHHDLYEVENENDIAQLYNEVIEDSFVPDIWKTKLEALNEIRERWDDEVELKMIDEMIKSQETKCQK